MRKIDFKVSESMQERDDEGFLLGGTIGPDLTQIVIVDRETGNQICAELREDNTKSIQTTFRIEREAFTWGFGRRAPIYATENTVIVLPQ